jgi:hypothetical protein
MVIVVVICIELQLQVWALTSGVILHKVLHNNTESEPEPESQTYTSRSTFLFLRNHELSIWKQSLAAHSKAA